MKRCVDFTVLSLLGVLAALAFSPGPGASSPGLLARQEHAESGAELIAALDDCIQKRFKDVDQGFGYRRIVRPGDTPHRFKPENVRELTVVDYLTRHKLAVVLYLAGRDVSGPDVNRIEVANPGKLLKGPVRVTPGDKSVTDLPTHLQLLDHAGQAMRAFQRTEDYVFNLSEWKFIARPVRASDGSCLKCHQAGSTSRTTLINRDQESKPLQIGDPLGVLIYGYKDNDQ